MTNHNPTLTNEQIKELLESNFGPIYSIETPYNNPYQRNIEFMDIRHAQKGRQAIGLSAKIPTISEVRPSPNFFCSGLRRHLSASCCGD